MSFTSRGVLADAATLWRAERELLVPLAGLFFVVPTLAAVLLVSGLQLPDTPDPEKMRAAIGAFYTAHWPMIVAIGLAMDFGSFAIFNLYLQGGGRTLGEVLLLTVKRFAGFFVISTLASILFSFGIGLILPGLFVLARTWLAGPAYAAEPGQGVFGAFRAGWQRSAGLSGFGLLGLGSMIMFVSFALVVIAGGILGTIAAVTHATQVVEILSYLVTAVIGGCAWTAFALIRISGYRLGAPKQGI